MSGHQEVTYTLDCRADRGERRRNQDSSPDQPLPNSADHAVPRIARLMALAIRFEGLLRNGTIRDYAELARLGRVTRARMTQIMKLLLLAPDIQEQILFLPHMKGLNERNLRAIASRLDWREQRLLFRKMVESVEVNSENPNLTGSDGSPGASVKPKVANGKLFRTSKITTRLASGKTKVELSIQQVLSARQHGGRLQ